jgi:hypothetical protein
LTRGGKTDKTQALGVRLMPSENRSLRQEISPHDHAPWRQRRDHI